MFGIEDVYLRIDNDVFVMIFSFDNHIPNQVLWTKDSVDEFVRYQTVPYATILEVQHV